MQAFLKPVVEGRISRPHPPLGALPLSSPHWRPRPRAPAFAGQAGTHSQGPDYIQNAIQTSYTVTPPIFCIWIRREIRLEGPLKGLTTTCNPSIHLENSLRAR